VTVRTIVATHVGVDTRRRNDLYTCNRCGIVKQVNRTRRNKGGDQVVLDRRTYKCADCLHVEVLERGNQCDESSSASSP
jgi:hypothetical protein